jgi:serine/threonine protein kinase
MAPELLGLENDNDSDAEVEPVITKKTDVYSLGMVGLEVGFVTVHPSSSSILNIETRLQILTGKIPFHTAKTDTVVINRIRMGRHPAENQPEILVAYGSTWSVLQTCWARDPISRPLMDIVVQRLPFE